MNSVKDILREILISFHLDVTKNIKYDRLTRKILKVCLKKNYNCIDVGCHKGEILNLMLKYSPEGKHYAFEPIPCLYNKLKNRYEQKASVFPYALSDTKGETTFQLVRNALAYSGIKRRKYNVKNPDIEEIIVKKIPLDEIVPSNEIIHFVKIDVEGGEFGVLRGARNLLKQSKPIILFEFGKGASDYYGTSPFDLFNYISNEIGLKIYTLQSYIKREKPINDLEFANYFNSNIEYYFIAASY